MVNPPVTFKVPVKFAALEIVWLLINPEVIVFVPRLSAPERVTAPALIVVAKRLVDEAVVAKREVVVAFVVVVLDPVKF